MTRSYWDACTRAPANFGSTAGMIDMAVGEQTVIAFQKIAVDHPHFQLQLYWNKTTIPDTYPEKTNKGISFYFSLITHQTLEKKNCPTCP